MVIGAKSTGICHITYEPTVMTFGDKHKVNNFIIEIISLNVIY